MSDIDNKVVSISFNNKQFLRDVQDTIAVIEELNEATSGKHINTSGIENLGRAFRNTTTGLTNDASSVTAALNNIQSAANINFQTGGIDALRKALENTGMTAVDVEDTITSLQQLSRTGISYASDLGVGNTAQQIQNASNDTRNVITQDIDDVSHQFSALEMIGIGAMIAIGEKAAEIGANALRSLTAGIRDGWAEYNALTNSTQTILVNTQRWGSTMEDVRGALEELNRYADMTIYSFSDMTRNIGYFTTAGINLEDSVTAIQGLSNVGAMFGADAQSVARAGYQISQAMSAGVIKLMDWRSMINAGMGGQALQDELIRTAAVMSGTSIDAMNEYIDSLGGFQASLQEGWLTSDIFLEAMKTFAGQSREYYESLTDENGNRLYDDETIDKLVEMGESAMESATKVRTLQQMMDAFSESIGSGWERTFTLIIGNLEEAKEFWSPINDILTSMVDGFFSLQTGALEAWRALGGREELIQGILNVLEGLNGVLSAIGGAFIDVFGSSHTIGNRLFRITEALTDFTETLILSEDELQDLRDFFGGILEPMGLIVDIIFELVQAFFNAGDAMNEFSEGTDSVMDGTRSFREALLLVLGSFGRILKAGAQFIRENNTVKKVIQTFAKVVKTVFTTVANVIAAPFILFYNIWQRYNIGEKLEEFWMKVVEFFLPIIDAVEEVKNVFVDWFDTLKSNFDNLDFDGIDVIVEIFGALKQLFRDIFDPTVSLSDAFGTFIDTLSGGHTGELLNSIKDAVANLWDQLKNTAIGQWFMDLKDKIQNAWTAFAQTPFGQWVSEIIDTVKDFIGLDTTDWDSFWYTLQLIGTDVANDLSSGWEKIKTFFSEFWDIIKEWFGISDAAVDAADATNTAVGAIGGGPFVGALPQVPGTNGIALALMETTDAAKYAEKNIPDPEDSRFLNFIRTIPQRLSDLFSFTSDDSLLQRVFKFVNRIKEFLRDLFNIGENEDESNNPIDWIVEHAKILGQTILDLLDIHIDVGNGGIFQAIGSIISSFINGFANIDAKALENLREISDIIVDTLKGIIALKIFQIIDNFSSIAEQAAKGWADQQAAKKLNAIAEVIKSIALSLLAIGAVVALVAVGFKTAPWAITGALIIVGVILVALFKGIKNIEATAKDIKPGSLSSISKIISGISKVLLSTIISIAALVGLAFIMAKIANSSDGGTFVSCLVTLAIVFGVIANSAYEFLLNMFNWANIFYTADAQKAVNAVADAVKTISGLLISMVIVVGGLIAATMVLTYFIHKVRENNAEADLLIAAGVIIGLLAVSYIVIDHLITTARDMSAGINGVKPSDFKQIMMHMSALLVSVVASVTVLIMAVTALTYIMSTSDIHIGYFIASAAIVVALILAVTTGLSLIFLSMNKIAGKKMSKIWSAFAMLIATLTLVGVGVFLLMQEASAIAERTSDLSKLAGTLLVFAGMFAIFIGAIAATILIVSNIDLRKATKERLTTLVSIAAGVVFAMVAIAGSLSLLAGVMGASGFTANGGSIIEVAIAVVTMLGALTIIIAALGALVQSKTLSAKGLMEVATSVVIMSLALVAISLALSGLVLAIGDGGNILGAAAAMFGIFAALVIALGIMTGIAKLDMTAMFTAAASMVIASLAFGVIAAAMSIIASIDTTQLITAGIVLGSLFLIMGTLLAIISAIGMGTGGIGIVAIIAAAGALILLSSSFLILAEAIKITGEGLTLVTAALDGFVDAFNNLQNLNVEGVASKFFYILRVIKVLADGVKEIVPVFGAIIFEAVKSIMAGLTSGFAVGFGEGMLTIAQFIMDYGPVIVTAFTALGVMIANSIHTVLLYFMAQIVADFGPGGTVRNMMSTLADFAMWLAGEAGAWAVDIVASFLESIALTLSDENKLARIVDAIRLLWLTAKKAFMDELGFADLRALGSHIVLEVLRGIVGAITTIAEGTMSPALQAALAAAGIDVDSIVNDLNGTLQSASQLAADDVFNSATLTAEIDELREHLDELGNATEEAYNGPSYDPTSYYRSISGAAQEATEATQQYADTTSTAATGLSSLLGGLNIGDALSNIDLSAITELFSGSSGSGLLGGLSGISDILGGIDLGGISGIISQLGGGGGISSILSGIIGGGGATSLISGLIGGEGFDLSGILSGLMTDDVTNPVITPVVNTDEYSLGLDNMEDLWNSHNFDEFAIDAGTSMTLREQAEGDATTNGAVTYNFTQYNTSPEALSPIQIYRDTNNLLRGRVNS